MPTGWPPHRRSRFLAPLPGVVSVVLVAVVTLAAGCSLLPSGAERSEDLLLGSWQVTSFNNEPILVDTNTAETPFLEFSRGGDGYQVSGSLGCNELLSGYSYDGQTLNLFEGSTTAMACELEGADGEAAAMTAELAISEVLFTPPVTATFDGEGEALVLRSPRGEVVLNGSGLPDGDDNRLLAPLTCSDGAKIQRLFEGSGLSQAEAAEAADPAVVDTAANAYTTYGLDSEGRVIAEVQNSDTAPGDYLVYTCDTG